MSWQTEWEFKGKYLNVTKLSHIGALADEDKVYRIFVSHIFGWFEQKCIHQTMKSKE